MNTSLSFLSVGSQAIFDAIEATKINLESFSIFNSSTTTPVDLTISNGLEARYRVHLTPGASFRESIILPGTMGDAWTVTASAAVQIFFNATAETET